MARDLLLGRTSRDWSCGQFPRMPVDKSRLLAQDVLADRDVGALARHVEATFQANYDRIVRLGPRMPADERRAYGKSMRRWRDLEASRGGKYLGQDFVELKDLDDVNAKISARISQLEKSATPPATIPPPASRSLVRLSLLNLAVGGAGLAAAIMLGRRLARGDQKLSFDT